MNHAMGGYHPVRWEMEVRCDAVASLSPQSLRALYEAGCRQINMGVEKASDQHLKGINKRLTTAEIIAACDNVKSVVPDLRLAGTFILGGPNEDQSDIEGTIAFAKSLRLDFAHFYPLEVYPGTPFFQEVFDGRSPTAWAYEMLEDDENCWGEILYETKRLSKDCLLEWTQEAYRQFYRREEWIERFTNSTQAEMQETALKVIERWCEDRFHLTPDEVQSVADIA